MSSSATAASRAQAAKVAKWLAEKSRTEEAIELLCSYAVAGPNDLEGQQLLADAFRMNPTSPIARMAFERMEGVAGDHADLETAMQRYGQDALTKLTREMSPNVFRRAQLGFNNNVKYKEHTYHVQTEDSGLDKPHVITHLFADGGRVIKSFKREYAEHVLRDDVAKYVKALMKGQHMEMVVHLREGRFDEVIAGRARGGMDLLTEAPRTEVQKISERREEGRGSVRPPPPAVDNSKTVPMASTPSKAPPRKLPHYVLFVERSLSGGPDHYPVFDNEAVVGSQGQLTLAGERFCHPREATLIHRDGGLFLRDLPGGNGVFLRIRSRIELAYGDEFILGDQVFRVDPSPPPTDDHPDPGPTYFYPAPNWLSQFRITQVFEGGATGRVAVARGGTVQLGSAIGDIIVNDALVSDQHCVVEEQAGAFVLTDLESRTGVFVRVGTNEVELLEGDEIIIGRTRLRVHITVQR